MTRVDRFTISERVRALETPRSDPATIRTAESTTGTYAVVGEQLESARVETETGTTSVTAIVPGDGSISSLHIKPGATVKSKTHTYDIGVVKGTDETAVQSHIGVSVHLDTYPKDAIAWRNGKPIRQNGETRWDKSIVPKTTRRKVYSERTPTPTDRLKSN